MAHQAQAQAQASTQSRTTTVAFPKEKTLVLRRRAEEVKREMKEKLLPGAKERLKQSLSSSSSSSSRREGGPGPDLEAAMRQTLESMRAEALASLDEMHAEILSHAPAQEEEPRRPRPGQSEEEFRQEQLRYRQDLAAFEAYAEEAAGVVESVTALLTAVMRRLREFSRYLWGLVQARDPQLDAKCQAFMAGVARELDEGFGALHGQEEEGSDEKVKNKGKGQGKGKGKGKGQPSPSAV